MGFDPKWLLFGLDENEIKVVEKVALRSLVVFHILFACNWLGFIGLYGFARADDLKRVEQTSIAAQKMTEDKVNTILRLQLSERIRNLVYERCLIVGGEAKSRKTSEIDAWQLEYERVSGGFRYPEPSC